jgi:hypothetical protein
MLFSQSIRYPSRPRAARYQLGNPESYVSGENKWMKYVYFEGASAEGQRRVPK